MRAQKPGKHLMRGHSIVRQWGDKKGCRAEKKKRQNHGGKEASYEGETRDWGGETERRKTAGLA